MDITRAEYSTPQKSRELVPIAVEFTGGLELLFSNRRKHQLSLPAKNEDGQAANVAFLVRYLCQHLMSDRREELFVMDGTVFVDLFISENGS